MLINKVCLFSAGGEWATPWNIFNRLSEKYGPFDLDVCATADNAKCRDFISPEQDALRQPWHGVCWMNPPYGRNLGQWILKAWRETCVGHARRVVCLLPARTDTRWWHNYVQKYASRIEFVRGRLKFEGARHNAPFPSAIVVFGNPDA
jgi:phage N-6-adenine-methyltransferase